MSCLTTYPCRDCNKNFATRKGQLLHMFYSGHMGGQICETCNETCATPEQIGLHQIYHRIHIQKNAAEKPGLITLKLQEHFLTQYWVERDDLEKALDARPNKGYPWASPALLEDTLQLLTLAVLDGGQTPRDLPPSVHKATSPECAAVAIACETVNVSDGPPRLERVSVVDFLTGAVVLDSRVIDSPVQLQEVGDVDSSAMKGTGSWKEVLKVLFAQIIPHAILIGYDLPIDMAVLHIEAERVVDSQVLVAQALCGKSGVKSLTRRGLQELCGDLMGIDIRQQVSRDTQEEALATRELVLWCLTHPDELKERGIYLEAEIENDKRTEDTIAEAGCAYINADDALIVGTCRNTEEVRRLRKEVDELNEKLERLRVEVDQIERIPKMLTIW